MSPRLDEVDITPASAIKQTLNILISDLEGFKNLKNFI